VFLAHGYNHIFGGGRIAGTGRWFESLGMRPGVLHAWFASLTELGAGALLIMGVATPFGCAGVIGTMVVAWITNHLRNGFFIFRPGEGYEYVLFISLTTLALGAVGGGRLSLDRAFGIADNLDGWTGLVIALAIGVGGSFLLLATCWRPASGVPSEG
jgi:putative oxidoreductase